jgi:sterol-4alpha-carboxylate 3-dehydrogenase (decarboxylating)
MKALQADTSGSISGDYRNSPRKAPTQCTGKTYLIIGGHGFLGSHVIEALLRRGETRIRVLDRVASSLFLPESTDGRVAFFQGDIRDAAILRQACRGVDTVFHTAAAINFWSDLPFEHDAIHAVNVRGTEQVIRACLAEGVKQLLFTSSASVVAPHDILQRPLVLADESAPYPNEPFLNHYIKTKGEAERLVRQAHGQGGLLTAAVRPGGLYGPRDPLLTPAIAAGLPGIGLKDNIIDHIYIENVVHAFLLLERHLVPRAPVGGQAYFVTNYEDPLPGCSSPDRSYFEFTSRFATALGRRFWLLPRPLLSMMAAGVQTAIKATHGRITRHLGELGKMRPSCLTLARATYYFSHRKAAADFGYQPLYSVAEGIAITVEHLMRTQKEKNGSAVRISRETTKGVW